MSYIMTDMMNAQVMVVLMLVEAQVEVVIVIMMKTTAVRIMKTNSG